MAKDGVENGSAVRSLAPVVPILLGFVMLSLAYNAAVPLLEAPDEPSHVAMVRYIAANGALPIQHPPGYFPVGQEGSQPPLYYALGAALFRLSAAPAVAPTFAAHNPFVTFDRSPGSRDNRNLYAHTAREAFPYRGDARGIHLVRLIGTALGAATVLLTFLLAGVLFPARRHFPVLAAALVAFDPQFIFISGVVNNDVAIAAAAAFVIWCLVRWCRRGGSTRLAVGLGLGLGVAALAKTDGILLTPLIAVVLLADVVFWRKVGPTIGRAVIVGSLAAIVAGWWFARNLILYGDLLGWDAMLAANASMIRHPALDVWSAVQVLWSARGTFWGAFGWTNVLYPDQVYRLLDAAAAMALAGLALSVLLSLAAARWRIRRDLPMPSANLIGARCRDDRWAVDSSSVSSRSPGQWLMATLPFLVMLAWPTIVFASLVRWVQVNAAADQWRLLFPAVGAIAVLLALGIDGWVRVGVLGRDLVFRRTAGASESADFGFSPGTPSSSARASVVAVLVALTMTVVGVGLNLEVVSNVVEPAFDPVAVVDRPSPARPLARFGQDVELVGYKIGPARLQPGESIDVDLVWRALHPIDHNWAVAVSLSGEDKSRLARVQSWPQGGRAPTSAWQPGFLYQDHYVLTPRWQSDEPQLAEVWLNLYNASVLGGPSLAVSDPSGHAVGDGIALGTVKLAATAPASDRPEVPVGARFGGLIDLIGYDRSVEDDTLRLTLHWQADRTPSEGYTVFVHLAGPSGRVVAQHDSPPRGGAYPTTAWDTREVVRDPHVVDLKGIAPGTYPVLVGLYRPTTGARLAARTAEGLAAPNDAIHLFDLTVP